MNNYHLTQAHIYANLSEARAKIAAVFAFKCAEFNEHNDLKQQEEFRKIMDKLSEIGKIIDELLDEHC